MTDLSLQCWNCGEPVDPQRIEYDALLVPRSESRGGPVLVFRCSFCAIDNVAERNPAGEYFLIPPPLAGVRHTNVRGKLLYRARKWRRENAASRAEFLKRMAPVRPSLPEREEETEPEEETPRPSTKPDVELTTVLEAYEVLDLPLTASPDEIRKRFRELSRKCHPDRVADLDQEIRTVAERRFRRIRRAYELLTGD